MVLSNTMNKKLRVCGEKGAEMKKELRQIVTVASIGSAVALLYACGGGGGGGGGFVPTGGGGGGTLGIYTGKTTQATITESSVKETLAGMGDILPSCTATGVAKTATDVQLSTVLKSVKLLVPQPPAKQVGKSVALLSPSAPSTQTGSCGGTISYPTYSHLSGTTTISVKLDNYCTVDSETGNKTTMNGTINAVDAGTPTNSGPVTTSLTASIPSLTVVEKTAAGATVSSTSIAMSNFQYVPATGATADVSNLPGTMTLATVEVKMVEGTTTKEFKVDNLTVTTTKAGADSQVAFSGTLCRGTSGCSAVATSTPLVTDPNQNFKSGVITFTGAGGSKATLTAVTGTGQNFNVNVNGTNLTGTQLKCDGI